MFSTVKKLFHSQGIFPQSTVVEIFHNQGIFPQSWKFSTNKEFYTVKKYSANKDEKVSLKAKISDIFNFKSYAKVFLAL